MLAQCRSAPLGKRLAAQRERRVATRTPPSPHHARSRAREALVPLAYGDEQLAAQRLEARVARQLDLVVAHAHGGQVRVAAVLAHEPHDRTRGTSAARPPSGRRGLAVT